MAMKDLVNAECGGVNALVKLTSHLTEDISLKQDQFRISRSTPSRGPDVGPRPLEHVTENEFVAEFLSEPRLELAPQTFHMGSLLQEMQDIEKQQYRSITPIIAPAVADLTVSSNWAEEYLAAEAVTKSENGFWANDFMEMNGRQSNSIMQSVSDQWAKELLAQNEHKIWNGNSQTTNDNTWADESLSDKKLKEVANEFVSNTPDPLIKNTETSRIDVQKWVEEFTQGNTDGHGESQEIDFWDKFQQEWQEISKSQKESHPWLSDFDEFQEDKTHKIYKFEEDNPLKDHPNAFKEGLDKLRLGDIPNAVLLFEAAVHQNPEHAEAWQYLGTTQADNEQESKAIAALNKSLELSPGNLKVLMALAVSYTNESLERNACLTLREWMENNPKYSHIVSPTSSKSEHQTISSFMSSSLHKEITDLFIKAVQTNIGIIDADIQVALGVLFNLSGEHNKAVDCFTAALQVRPDDSSLWNKLGATLANGNKSEKAVEAYHRALELSPGYIRTRYNLGIACINLGTYRQSIQHFISALNLQKQSRGPKGEQSIMSDNIWSTMRMAITLLGKTELLPYCEVTDLDGLNNFLNNE